MKRLVHTTTKEKTETWEVAMPLLEAMFGEFKELSKKKAEGVASKGNIGVVNRLLSSCRRVLEHEQSMKFIDLLDEDDLPQNSDVVLMLSQYVAAMKQFRSRYSRYDPVLGEKWSVD